jgi:hypothetical protein
MSRGSLIAWCAYIKHGDVGGNWLYKLRIMQQAEHLDPCPKTIQHELSTFASSATLSWLASVFGFASGSKEIVAGQEWADQSADHGFGLADQSNLCFTRLTHPCNAGCWEDAG